MRNALVSAVVGAAVGAAVVGIAASGILRFGNDKKMVYATIWLDRLRDDNCYINTMPQTLEVKKNETVEWSIVDRCRLADDAMVEIAFTNEDPTNCEKRGKKKIKCAMKSEGGGPEVKSYEYKVSAPGAITEDPELEIVQ